MNQVCGLLVNSSRGIIYAGNGTDFSEKTGNEAQKLQQQMAIILSEAGIKKLCCKQKTQSTHG